jgi:choline dehydrogenase-like flavoprotein
MNYIVGSGPAGIACAYALASAGQNVTILDGGLTLEPERGAAMEAVGQKNRASWTKSEAEFLRTNPSRDGDVPLKLVGGSDYPYRRAEGTLDVRYGPLRIRSSYAVGGLSNVWGATLLPYRAPDIGDWPIGENELRASYAEVLKFVPLAGSEDALSEIFPLPAADMAPYRGSPQIAALIRTSKANNSRLNGHGVYVGSARLAVDFAGRAGGLECNYCGHCLHGCPRDLIYSSRHSLNSLLLRGGVRHLPGVLVRSVQETGEAVSIHVTGQRGAPATFLADRVFIAAGTINTTAILLRSMGLFDTEVQFKDAQYYRFPMLQLGSVSNIADEEVHTLCQSFIEILDERVSPYTVHAQVYGYNDQLPEVLRYRLGFLRHLIPTKAVLGRLLVVQGYLHSAHSGLLSGRLRRHGSSDSFELEQVRNAETRSRIAKVLRKLTGQAAKLGALAISPLSEIAEVGRGFRTGGTFPMARRPTIGQTDLLGRPSGMDRIHVIDASVFPTIPATPITLSVMANAYRIGLEAGRLASSTRVAADAASPP